MFTVEESHIGGKHKCLCAVITWVLVFSLHLQSSSFMTENLLFLLLFKSYLNVAKENTT